MKRSVPVVVLALAGLCASSAVAGPNPKYVKSWRPAKSSARPAPGIYTPTDGAFFENFDSYANGSNIIGQGGWQGWFGSVNPDAFVSNEQAASAPHSLRLTAPPAAPAESDIVRTHNITGGKWEYTAKVYVPTGSVGTAYFILLNTYPTFDWSLDLGMNTATGIVNTIEPANPAEFPGAVANQVTLVRDQWVDIRAEIDLDAGSSGRLDVYYDNQLVTSGISWNTGGARTLQALDLYSNGCDKFFYDDVKLEAVGTCYPDCNLDLVLNLADFGCFQTNFALGNMYADCNGDLVLNLADFGCFQTSFAIGCP
jgi:hypothetical protein